MFLLQCSIPVKDFVSSRFYGGKTFSFDSLRLAEHLFPFSAFNMTQTQEYVDIELLRVDSLTFASDMNQTLARDPTEEIYRGHI